MSRPREGPRARLIKAGWRGENLYLDFDRLPWYGLDPVTQRGVFEALMMTISSFGGFSRVRTYVRGEPVPAPSVTGSNDSVRAPSYLIRLPYINGFPIARETAKIEGSGRESKSGCLGGAAERHPGSGVQGGERAGTEKPLSQIEIAAVGDIMLGRKIGRLMAERGLDYPFDATRSLIQGAGIAFGNLECSLSSKGSPIPGKGIWLRGSPSSIRPLSRSGFDVLSLANNHILDYDTPALMETLDVLDEAGILAVGAGRDIYEARLPAWVEVEGFVFAFLGYTRYSDIYWDPSYKRTFEAAANKPGVAPLKEEMMVEDVSSVRDEADVVVVSLHWGEEGENVPRKEQRDLAMELTEAGADLILGHHPHVVQGVERTGDGAVVYSMGNFVYDQRREKQVESMMARATFVSGESGGGVFERLEILPLKITEGQPHPVEGSDLSRLLASFRGYSAILGTDLKVEDDRLVLEIP